jgi:hypothetical protein
MTLKAEVFSSFEKVWLPNLDPTEQPKAGVTLDGFLPFTSLFLKSVMEPVSIIIVANIY